MVSKQCCEGRLTKIGGLIATIIKKSNGDNKNVSITVFNAVLPIIISSSIIIIADYAPSRTVGNISFKTQARLNKRRSFRKACINKDHVSAYNQIALNESDRFICI